MTSESISWAKDIAGLVKHITGKEQIVASAFGGMVSEIAWIAHYNNIAEYDGYRVKILAEDKYLDALKTARNLFLPDSGRDQFWQHE